MAAKLPTNNDTTAKMPNICDQSANSVPKPPTKIRNVNTTAAILGAVPTNAATEVGAPSYTSGTHIWKGTAPNLKATATTINTKPSFNNQPFAIPLCVFAMTSANSNEPVAPYTKEIPYNNKPEANAPNTKYFNAASAERAESRRNAIMAYKDKDNSSKPI